MRHPEIDIRLTLKGICLFEELRDKSFYSIEDEEDTLYLLYALYITSTGRYDVTIDVFKLLLEDRSVLRTISQQYTDIMSFLAQFGSKKGEDEEVKETTEKPKISTIVYYLISHGIDPEYVMNKMQLFEVSPLVNSLAEKEKNTLEQERLFAYLKIAFQPFIDVKKLKSPSDILPFPWEQDELKKQREEDYKKKESAIRAVLGLDKEEKNG